MTTTHFVPKYKLRYNVIPKLIGLSYCIQNSGVYMQYNRVKGQKDIKLTDH
jgi:hypothetical protein